MGERSIYGVYLVGKDSLIRIGKKSFGLDNGMKRTKEECEAVRTAPGVCTINSAIFRRHLAVSVWTILRGMSGHGGARMPRSRVPCIHAGSVTTWHVGA